MRQVILSGFAVLAIALLANPSFATRHEPKKAGKFKAALTTAYKQCTAPNTSNTSTTPTIPACSPAVPDDATCFIGDKGSGQVSAKADPSGDIAFRIKLKDIQNCNGQSLVAVVSARVTTDDCANADPNGCTLQDIPAFPISSGSNCSIADGKCQMKSTVNSEIGSGTLQANKNTNIELTGCFLQRVGPATRVAACGLLVP